MSFLGAHECCAFQVFGFLVLDTGSWILILDLFASIMSFSKELMNAGAFWIGFSRIGYGSFSFADTKMLKLSGVWKLFRLRSGFARRR